MNEIVMIPIDQLYHHPENPRLDLGDLTELTESIRANGIMQNLTVIPGHRMSKKEWTEAARAEGADKASAEASYSPENAEVSDGYTVVIGNRRMEASKAAGLTELPCVISDMDHKTQITTMLQENMQRADLTVYEQAQGFQMMIDLGIGPKEISEKTGFSETTVRRRLKMAELDKNTFRKAVGKQITMDDLDRLAKIESVKQRNALLKGYGENNYDWNVTRAIQVQESAKHKKAARRCLKDAEISVLPDKDRYTYGKYRELYNEKCRLYEWDGKKNIIPKIKVGKLFYLEDDTSISFYLLEPKKKNETPQKSAEEKEEEKKRALAWKTVDRSAEIAADLRKKFVEDIGVNPKNAMEMMQWAFIAAFSSMMSYESPTMALKNRFVRETVGHSITDSVADMAENMKKLPQSKWPELILMMFEGDWKERKGKPPMFAEGSRNYEYPKYKRKVMLEYCYEWLTQFGYSMSTEEIEMMTGTHPVFQTEVRKDG